MVEVNHTQQRGFNVLNGIPADFAQMQACARGFVLIAFMPWVDGVGELKMMLGHCRFPCCRLASVPGLAI
ncbi:hypothetical protein D3C80_1890450 [compost metagenome]